MKAITHTQYGPPDVLRLIDIDKPTAKNNEVLIGVIATTVTATACTFRKGKSFYSRLFTGLIKPKHPILGSEFAGEIEAVIDDRYRFEQFAEARAYVDMGHKRSNVIITL